MENNCYHIPIMERLKNPLLWPVRSGSSLDLFYRPTKMHLKSIFLRSREIWFKQYCLFCEWIHAKRIAFLKGMLNSKIRLRKYFCILWTLCIILVSCVCWCAWEGKKICGFGWVGDIACETWLLPLSLSAIHRLRFEDFMKSVRRITA